MKEPQFQPFCTPGLGVKSQRARVAGPMKRPLLGHGRRDRDLGKAARGRGARSIVLPRVRSSMTKARKGEGRSSIIQDAKPESRLWQRAPCARKPAGARAEEPHLLSPSKSNQAWWSIWARPAFYRRPRSGDRSRGVELPRSKAQTNGTEACAQARSIATGRRHLSALTPNTTRSKRSRGRARAGQSGRQATRQCCGLPQAASPVLGSLASDFASDWPIDAAHGCLRTDAAKSKPVNVDGLPRGGCFALFVSAADAQPYPTRQIR